MIEIKDIDIKVYQYGHFYIYIIHKNGVYEYYLQHRDYGIIELVYGLEEKDIIFDDFVNCIDASIENDINDYMENRNE